jgi:hypothetical protein
MTKFAPPKAAAGAVAVVAVAACGYLTLYRPAVAQPETVAAATGPRIERSIAVELDGVRPKRDTAPEANSSAGSRPRIREDDPKPPARPVRPTDGRELKKPKPRPGC